MRRYTPHLIRAALLIALFFLVCPGLRAESLFMRYRLPPMDRLQGEARKLWLNSLLYKRLQQLPVSFSQTEDVKVPDILRSYFENTPWIPAGKTIVFRGRTLSELAGFLEKVRPGSTVEVVSPKILADTTLRIPSRIHLKDKSTEIEASNLSERPIFLLENTHKAAVSGFIFLRAPLGIVVRNSQRIYLSRLTFREGGIAIACVGSGNKVTIEEIYCLTWGGLKPSPFRRKLEHDRMMAWEGITGMVVIRYTRFTCT